MAVRLRTFLAAPHGKALIVALVTLGVLLAAFHSFVDAHRRRLAAGQRLELALALAPYGNALATAVNRRLALAEGLRAFVESNWSTPGRIGSQFDTFAAGLYAHGSGVRALQVLPDAVTRYVYPLKGNEASLGFNPFAASQRELRDDARRALETGAMAISGPRELLQGGLGMIGRLALFRNGRFWGMVAVVIDVPPLLAEAGLAPAPGRMRIAVRDAGGHVFHGDAAVLSDNPVVHPIRLPDGAWDLAAIPAAGWGRIDRASFVMGRTLGLAVVVLLSAVVFLIVERRERSRRRSEDERNRLFQLSTELLCIAGMDGRFQLLNPAWERCLGFTVEELRAMPLLELVHPDDRASTAAAVGQLAAGNTVVGFANRYRTSTGDYRWLEWNSVPVEGRIYAVARDITGRKGTEQALRESEARLARAQSLAQLGNWERDLVRGGVVWSPEVYRIFGVDPASARASQELFYSLVHPEDRSSVRAAVESAVRENTPYTVDHRIVRPDGTERVVREFAEVMRDESGKPLRLMGAVQDITEYKRLEEHLRQSQKMEAIGTLAGGVAHDFNNLLTVITGYSQILLSGLPSASPLRAALLEIDRAGQRAAALTRQLLAFSRRQMLQPEILNLNSIINDTTGMLRRLLREDVELIIRLDPSLKPVQVDRSQIEQVILNLVVNARDAMPRGGKLTIETANVESAPGRVSGGPQAGSGPLVRLAITDSGCGMSPEIRARIFEPFFTTKEQGKGTGMGLSTVYGIVQQSGGFIEVQSEEGQGSSFEVFLPVCPAPAAPEAARIQPAVPAGGTETVLIAEDEPALRSLASRILSGCGYRVLEAADGRQAIEICQTHDGPVHLLLTDMVMPGMGGQDLAACLRSLHPELRVLFMSGYIEDGFESAGQEMVHFLQKPFTPEGLSSSVRKALDHRPPDPGTKA